MSSITAMEPNECITCSNLVPSEYGLRLRKGYIEWAKGMTGGPVRTIIGFTGQLQNGTNKKLWAVTSTGIWDVTAYGTTVPTHDVTFTGTGNGAGFGVYCEMTNTAGDRFLFYADEVNGLHMYTETSGAWTVPTMTVVTPADVAFVMVWKQRLWMIERDSGDAYYLAPGAITGAATLFNFGAKLTHGGECKALFNWTIDGGAGIDDNLIVLGGGGDVLVYAGTDPSLPATFQMQGSYFIGKFPSSRRVGLAYGGEMYLLSTYGVISVRQLLEGVMYEDPSLGPSAKINRFLRDAVATNIDSYVWAMTIYPADGFMQIIAPYSTSNRNSAIQYNQNLMTQAWGLWNGVPINCAASWNGEYMMGTPDGTVIQYYGGLDAVTLAGTPAGVNINYSVLTSFQAPGGDATSYKRVGFIRPIQITRQAVSVNIGAIYDYDINAVLEQPSAAAQSTGATWADVLVPRPTDGRWDISRWGADPQPESFVRGSLGMGRVVAIAMSGNSSTRLTFVAWDVDFVSGGFL